MMVAYNEQSVFVVLGNTTEIIHRRFRSSMLRGDSGSEILGCRGLCGMIVRAPRHVCYFFGSCLFCSLVWSCSTSDSNIVYKRVSCTSRVTLTRPPDACMTTVREHPTGPMKFVDEGNAFRLIQYPG